MRFGVYRAIVATECLRFCAGVALFCVLLIQQPDIALLELDAQKAFVELSAFSKKFDAILAEIQSGKGTLGKLLNDEEAYREMTAFMKNMNAFAVKLNADKGSLAKFMMDDGRFYNNLNSTLENLDTLAKMMSNKKGTLNKLMTDDSLYNEMRDTVREIRSAVDDLREMAPVATFGSVLLGAL